GAAAFDAATRRLQGLGGVVGHSVGRRGSRAAGEVSIGIRRKLCSDDAQLPLSSNIVRHEQMHAGGGATSFLPPSACSAMTDDNEDHALTNGPHSRRQNQDLEFTAGSARERGDYGEHAARSTVIRPYRYTAGSQVSTPSWGSTSATGRTHHHMTARSLKITFTVHQCQRPGTTAFFPGDSFSLGSHARREDSSLPGRYVSPDEYPSTAEHGRDRFAEQGSKNTSSGTDQVAAVHLHQSSASRDTPSRHRGAAPTIGGSEERSDDLASSKRDGPGRQANQASPPPLSGLAAQQLAAQPAPTIQNLRIGGSIGDVYSYALGSGIGTVCQSGRWALGSAA
ncbi:unnamed protein product, partial [Tilletia caries]